MDINVYIHSTIIYIYILYIRILYLHTPKCKKLQNPTTDVILSMQRLFDKRRLFLNRTVSIGFYSLKSPAWRVATERSGKAELWRARSFLDVADKPVNAH